MPNNYESADVALSLVVGLLLGFSVYIGAKFLPQKLTSAVPVPYTASMLLLGGLVGFSVANKTGAEVKYLHKGLIDLQFVTPHTLFTIFLPAIIVSSGVRMHWHVFKRMLGHAVWLAYGATAINVALIAVVVRYMLPYDWPWSACLLFAIPLAAVDPVAVLAIMQSCDVSTKLEILIEGESIINDGVTYVFYEFFKGLVAGHSLAPGQAISFFFRASLGGPALGVLFAFGTMAVLRLLCHEGVVEVTVTLVAAFAVWVVSDQVMQASGILSLVAYAVTMGALGKQFVSSSAAPQFDFLWTWVEWMANTLSFYWFGMIIVGRVYRSTTITASDWGYAALLWVLLEVIRGMVILASWPILSRGRYNIELKDMVVLTLAGLRGGVGLILALAALDSPELLDQRFREHVFFYTAVATVATVVVQGTLMPWVLQGLGYLTLSRVQKEVEVHAIRALKDMTSRQVERLREEDSMLGPADWDAIERLVKTQHTGREEEPTGRAIEEVADGDEFMPDVRERLLHAVRQQYAHALKTQYLSADESFTLDQCVSKALDDTHERLSDWSHLETYLTPLDSNRTNLWFGVRHFMIQATETIAYLSSKLLSLSSDTHAERGYGRDAALVSAFACAHAAAQRELLPFAETEMGGSLAERPGDELKPVWSLPDEGNALPASRALQEAQRHAAFDSDHRRPQILLANRRQIVEAVLQESRDGQAKAEAHLAALRKKAPDAVKALRTRQVALAIMTQRQSTLKELMKSGMLKKKEIKEVGQQVDTTIKRLHVTYGVT